MIAPVYPGWQNTTAVYWLPNTRPVRRLRRYNTDMITEVSGSQYTEDGDPVQLVERAPLFRDIPRELIEQNRHCLVVNTLRDGDVILREGEPNHAVFLVLSGSVSVWKAVEGEAGGKHRIATLKAGEEFGEVSLLDGGGASATVCAEGGTRIVRINLAPSANGSAVGKLRRRVQVAVGQRIAGRLRQHNRFSVQALERELEESRLRTVAGHFVILVVVMSTLYTIAMKVITDLELTRFLDAYASPIIILVFVSGILTMMKLSPFSFRFFGVTLKGWKPAMRDAVIFSLWFCAVITAARWFYIQMTVDGSAQVFQVARVFATYDASGHLDWSKYVLAALAYMALCPVQELACRCGAQAPIYTFLRGNRRTRHLWSILASNLLFAAAHSHLNLMFGVLTFIPGLFWGWLFMRHRSIVGVSVSHAMIGVYALFVLGAEDLLR